MVSFIITAPLHCLNAHMIITSGASRARHIRNIRRFRSIKLVSPRNGTFGCTETHVTAKVVARQLQTISHTERRSERQAGLTSRVRIDASQLGGSEKQLDGGSTGAAVVS